MPAPGEEGFHATPRSQIRWRRQRCWSSSAQTASQPVGEVEGSGEGAGEDQARSEGWGRRRRFGREGRGEGREMEGRKREGERWEGGAEAGERERDLRHLESETLICVSFVVQRKMATVFGSSVGPCFGYLKTL